MADERNADIQNNPTQYTARQYFGADVEDDDGNVIFDYANGHIPDSIIETDPSTGGVTIDGRPLTGTSNIDVSNYDTLQAAVDDVPIFIESDALYIGMEDKNYDEDVVLPSWYGIGEDSAGNPSQPQLVLEGPSGAGVARLNSLYVPTFYGQLWIPGYTNIEFNDNSNRFDTTNMGFIQIDSNAGVVMLDEIDFSTVDTVNSDMTGAVTVQRGTMCEINDCSFGTDLFQFAINQKEGFSHVIDSGGNTGSMTDHVYRLSSGKVVEASSPSAWSGTNGRFDVLGAGVAYDADGVAHTQSGAIYPDGPELVYSESFDSTQSSITVTDGIDGSHDRYDIELTQITVDTDGATLQMQMSTDNGSTWLSGASEYSYQLEEWSDSIQAETNATTSEIRIAGDLGNAVGENVSGTVTLSSLNSVNEYTLVAFDGTAVRGDGSPAMIDVAGMHNDTANVDAVRFILSSGSFDGGEVKVYGK